MPAVPRPRPAPTRDAELARSRRTASPSPTSRRPTSAAARSHRRRARRTDRRGDARHLRVLPDARAHHARADHARASASSPSKPTGRTPRASTTTCATRTPAVRVAGVRALSDLDVAQHETASFVDWLHARNAGFRSSGARRSTVSICTACTRRSGRARRTSTTWTRRRRASRAALRLSHALAGRPGELRPSGAHGAVPHLRGRRGRMLVDMLQKRRTTPSTTASATSMRRRTPGSWRTRSATTGPCTTARARRGICATSTCTRRCRTCCAFHGPEAEAWCGRTTRTSATRAPPRCRARRTQHRPAVPRTVRPGRLRDRLRHRTTARWRPRRTGTRRCKSRRCGPPSEQLRAAVPLPRRAALPAAAARRRRRAARGTAQPRLERAIGVIYRPESELQSHYFQAVLPRSSTSTSGSTRPAR